MSKKVLWLLFLIYLSLLIKLIFYKRYIGRVLYPNYYGLITVSENFKRANFVPFKTLLAFAHEGADLFALQNIAGNILLFVPLGVMLPILIPAFRSAVRMTIMGFALSAGFELIQLITVLGLCDIDDTILNTAGSVIGFLIFKTFTRYNTRATAA